MGDGRRVATVTQINNYIKALFDKVPVLQNVWIKGEISNFKLHSSGHIYLTLKDENSVIKAVMFKYAAMYLNFKPKDGTKVLARGKINVYEAGGQYQLYIEEMEEEGKGDLYAKFEALKKQLSDEGLFDEGKKKPLPKFPETIGIVTSPTGAAIRDMINVLKRRCPMVKVIIYPCLVQGDNAAESIVAGIEYFNSKKKVDVIIAGRGGGSIEDLWAFNEEVTARAVAASEIPVISAVGHEVDFTICDFVADMRAPTPSAAAEIAVPDIVELRHSISLMRSNMAVLLKNKVDAHIKHLDLLSKRSGITQFEKSIFDRNQKVDSLFDRCINAFKNNNELAKNQFAALCGKLSALNPLAVFERGYCSASKDGKTLNSVSQLNTGDVIQLKMTDGEVDCSVTDRRSLNEI
ncbi:MAG: exodeoxyribonuclease VII large subunit [Ruminococcaceae bacterium]|nr:exodeoxyribonuclease VII large subunit [Oscillospiraceae bacterium]